MIERRFFKTEMRMDGQGRIEGYAAVFNQWSVDLGGFRERIRTGTFATAITRDDVRGLFNHNPDHILGRNVAGTLELAEDSQGLHFRVMPPPTPWADGLKVSIERGDVDQASFGFWTERDEWGRDEVGTTRELIEAGLMDVGPVTFPAYPQTAVAVRSLQQVIGSMRSMNSNQGMQDLICELEGLLPAGLRQVAQVPVGDEDDGAAGQVQVVRLRRRLDLVQQVN